MLDDNTKAKGAAALAEYRQDLCDNIDDPF